MPEAFTTIRIEALQSDGTWYNLTPDVKTNPPPRVSGMGGLGFGITDRIGGVGVFSFTLDNSQGNSAATLGYYTPGGEFGGGKIVPRSYVRVYFEYDGWRRYKYFGRVDQDGLAVSSGKYRERTVSVRCSNWMADAARHKVYLMGYQVNQTFDSAFRSVLMNMPVQPQNILFYGGQQVFPTVFDISRTNTTALGELNKLVFSEWGRAYIKGGFESGETLVLEDYRWYGRKTEDGTLEHDNGTLIPKKQSDVTSNITFAAGGNITFAAGGNITFSEKQRAAFTETDVEEMQWIYGQNVYDRVTFKTYPRDIQTGQTLWSVPAGEPIMLEAGQQVTDLRCSYTDPSGGFAKVNGLNDTMSTTHAAFENSDGTGTNYTSSVTVAARYGTAEVEYTLTNNAGVRVYVTQLDATGSGVFIYDTNDKTYTYSNGSLDSPVDIDLPYLANINGIVSTGYDDSIWTGMLNGVGISQGVVKGMTMTVNKTSKQMLAFLFLEPRDFMIISDTMTKGPGGGDPYSRGWHIQSYDFEIINGKTVRWYVDLKPSGVA